MERERLAHRVHAGRGVDDEQHLLRRLGDQPLDDPADLAELGHEVDLGVQAPGGVDEHDVDAPRLGCLDRVEHHGAGIGSGLVRHHVGPGAVRPDAHLVDRRRPVGVGGGDQRGAALLAEAVRELAEGGRLAAAVDPDHEDDARHVARGGGSGRTCS